MVVMVIVVEGVVEVIEGVILAVVLRLGHGP